MPTPGEYKTVQARILEYAAAICWTFVSREQAERRRGFDPDAPPAERARGRCSGSFAISTPTLRQPELRRALRNRGKFFDHEEKRERNLILIDYDDPARNVYEVTEDRTMGPSHDKPQLECFRCRGT